MEITVSIGRTVIIYNDVDTFYINASSENISCDKDTLLEGFEGGVAFDTITPDMNVTNIWPLTYQLRTVPLGPTPSGC